MQFAKYIKEHPLPPLTPEQISAGLKEEARKLWQNNKLYTAFVNDGVLNVVVYGKGENELVPTYRHVYDGDIYATLRYSDGKKLSGTIFTYLSYYCNTALDEASEKAICDYLDNENGLRALKAAEEFEKQLSDDSKWLKKYLKERFSDEDVSTAYDLIIRLPQFNKEGLIKILERMDELSELNKYLAQIELVE